MSIMLRTDSDYFENLIRNDPGFVLLKSNSASLVISFFYQEFAIVSRLSILESDLEMHLGNFLDEHKEDIAVFDADNSDDQPDLYFVEQKDKKQKIRGYVEKWCKKGFLVRYYNDNRDAVLELASSISKLFKWLDDLKPQKFIGTESQFKSILDLLHDVYQHITEDAESRLKVLRQERDVIDAEIKRLEAGGKVKSYTPLQIYEKVDLCLKNGKNLINDFRQVEENFRQVGSEIYKKQNEINTSKGEILGFTLDTDEKLRQSPQGQSFDAFWKFIAEDNDNEINAIANTIIKRVSSDIDVGQFDSLDTDFLLNFKKNLFEAGNKIIDSKHGITDRLSRILQQNQNGNYQKLNSVINDIKNLAAQQFNTDDYEDIKDFMFFDTKPIIHRSAYPVLPKLQKDFEDMGKFDSSEYSLSDLSDLLNQFYVDRNQLISNIENYRKTHFYQFTLRELLKDYPITKGLAEIAVYYDLVHTEEGLVIENSTKEQLSYEWDGFVIKVLAPKLIIQGGNNG